jgi:dsDNA-specific endonuclease/ATPase MutS2
MGLGIFAVVLIVLGFVVLGPGGEAAQDDAADDEEEEPPDLEHPVEIPIEDFIDLHPFPPRDVPDVVSDYLEEAHARGYREVRLIHGRGIGVQRERVRSLLSKHPLVESYSDAPPDGGGWGATLAVLKQNQ